MITANLNTLAPATLAALGKAVADAAKGNRENLPVGTHSVNEVVVVGVSGTVKVGEDFEQQIVGKAKPWSLLTAALKLANEQLIAAGVAGIDMEKVIEAAEVIDAEAVKTAKAKATLEVASRKAPTVTACKGKVNIAARADVALPVAPVVVAEESVAA